MVPRYFTWKTRSKSWSPRVALRRKNANSEDEAYDSSGTSANVVIRIYTVSPKEAERYFLRLLLTQMPGETSFENLRNIDGEEGTSFRQACLRLGLLAENAEWKNATRHSFRSSFFPLSHLFVTILAHCKPLDPLSLWKGHLHMFSPIFTIAHADNLFEDSSFAMITTPHLKCYESYRRPCRPCVRAERPQTSDSHCPITVRPPWNSKKTSRPPKHKRGSGKSHYRCLCSC